MMFKIAFRNVFRNRRRSLMTMLAIAVGAVAIVLFGEFIGFIRVALKTMTIESVGHLTVFRSGYFDYGAGNPLAFGIDDYQGVIRLIQEDPEIKPMLNVITPTVSVAGIAGNFEVNASKTFFGTGFVPSDRDRMLRWDEQGIFTTRVRKPSGLHDEDEASGVVGV
jgi:putative ABC transport system permease protein